MPAIIGICVPLWRLTAGWLRFWTELMLTQVLGDHTHAGYVSTTGHMCGVIE